MFLDKVKQPPRANLMCDPSHFGLQALVKNPGDGAAEGARFIADPIIRVSDRAFDDFVKSDADRRANRAMLGLED
jgi:hypothetical protein